jgi:hypothetical protein
MEGSLKGLSLGWLNSKAVNHLFLEKGAFFCFWGFAREAFMTCSGRNLPCSGYQDGAQSVLLP